MTDKDRQTLDDLFSDYEAEKEDELKNKSPAELAQEEARFEAVRLRDLDKYKRSGWVDEDGNPLDCGDDDAEDGGGEEE